MSDSNVTKRVMSDTLKELLKEVPYEKVTVSLICEKCGMSRKSFYYHYKDKYDLVNWIFDHDYSSFRNGKEPDNTGDGIVSLVSYFYKYREFYKSVFSYVGQNSFEKYLKNQLIIKYPFSEVNFEEAEMFETYKAFSSDVICMFIKNWVINGDEEIELPILLEQFYNCLSVLKGRIPKLQMDIKKCRKDIDMQQ